MPLGPFLGKSFATSVSAWVTPLAALAAARVPAWSRTPSPSPTSPTTTRGRSTCGSPSSSPAAPASAVVARPPFAQMYWTPGQQLAHLTVNGASLRTGDLFASGTVSGPEVDQRGSFLELSWGGREPLAVAGIGEVTFLEDGDVVTIRGEAAGRRHDDPPRRRRGPHPPAR